MAIFTIHPIPTFIFGLLGNIISFLVFLSPLPTFYRVYKKKSTEGFQSIPYVISLFSAMLWLYYTLVKAGDSFLLSINSLGCVIQSIYIAFYLFYAPKKAKIFTLKLVMLFNVFGFGVIVASSLFLAKGETRISVLGWICDSISVSVFVAPLGIMRKVIKTRSVEYMPFFLSFSLTLSAIMWFFYGLLLKDYFVAVPNILGFGFGVLQMILYMIYKNKKKAVVEEQIKFPEQIIEVAKLETIAGRPEVAILGIKPTEKRNDLIEEIQQTKKSKVETPAIVVV